MSSKLAVAFVGAVLAVGGSLFLGFSPPIARAYNAFYSHLPGHLRFSSWWPRAFGSMLLAFGALFVVLAITVVR